MRRFRAQDALILTLPIVLFIGYAGVAAFLDYRRARQYDDWWSHARELDLQLAARLSSAFAIPRMAAVRDRLDPAVDDPRAIRLLADRSLLESLTDLTQRGWIDATLVREGGNRQVDIRRRGDTSVHWTTPKVSLTVRTQRGEEIRGFRELALTGKTVLESHVAHSIAEEFGLLVPFSALAPVYLNEQFYGLFRAVEPIDESFLRRARRMPGNVYRADLAERGEYYKNVERNVFRNPYIWDRVAELNDPYDRPLGRLVAFLDDVRGTSLESHLDLMGRLDGREVARLLAAVLAVGDPYHLSGVHNQFWFDDPATGTLHPIPWDLRLRSLDARPTNPLNPFLEAVLRDPRVADETLQIVHATLEAGLVDRMDGMVDSLAAAFGPHLEYESLRAGLVSAPGNPADVKDLVRRNGELLLARASDARLGFSAFAPGDGSVVLDLEVRGWAGVDLTGLSVAGDGGSVTLWADRDLDGVLSPGDEPLEASAAGDGTLVLARPLALLPAWGVRADEVVAERTAYRLFVAGSGVTDVRVEVVNRVTGGPVEILAIEDGAALGGRTGFHAWEFPVERPEEVRLQGTVELTETLRIGPLDRLVIEPGTTLRLGPDVSIFSRGRVEAPGAPDRPIRFIPADDELPWGALALQGTGASGSRFANVEFVGGGGARLDGVAYKGMVSVYGARDVVLSDVRFADNRRSDDSFNAVYADVRLERCHFVNANGDAVDYDNSTGSISGCLFEDSRNDAIDLMTSSPIIRSNVMLRSGDKGVSIGEASHPILIDNEIRGSVRGIEIKDRSDPLILHNTIEGTSIGVLGQVKNWRYGGGGRGRILRSVFRDNEVDLSLDADSRLAVLESEFDGSEPTAIDARWPSRAFGVPASAAPGALPGTPAGEPASPSFALRFDDTVPFDETAHGWTSRGRVALRIQDRALRAAVERGAASWETPIDWEVDAPSELTVESVGRDLVEARIVLVSAQGEVTGSLELPATRDRTGLATIALPPGRYQTLRITAEADPDAVWVDPVSGLAERRGGRVDLLRVQVFDAGEAR